MNDRKNSIVGKKMCGRCSGSEFLSDAPLFWTEFKPKVKGPLQKAQWAAGYRVKVRVQNKLAKEQVIKQN